LQQVICLPALKTSHQLARVELASLGQFYLGIGNGGVTNETYP